MACCRRIADTREREEQWAKNDGGDLMSRQHTGLLGLWARDW